MRRKEILKQMRRRLGISLIALALTTGSATAVHALSFDPDGGGPVAPIDLGTLDWGPTSFLAINGVSAIQNFAPGCTTTCQFTVLTQAVLTATLDSFGVANTPSGLGTSYQITMVASLTERVTNVVGNTAFFATVPGSTGFLNIFFDTALNAS